MAELPKKPTVDSVEYYLMELEMHYPREGAETQRGFDGTESEAQNKVGRAAYWVGCLIRRELAEERKEPEPFPNAGERERGWAGETEDD